MIPDTTCPLGYYIRQVAHTRSLIRYLAQKTILVNLSIFPHHYYGDLSFIGRNLSPNENKKCFIFIFCRFVIDPIIQRVHASD